ncbi:MAG TPA: dihydroorotase family protein [Vicinamibacterales bacterium]|nr:dihydroorotase family protein [Vicinamibacterales bacterium]
MAQGPFDLLISGGTLVSAGRAHQGTVAVRDGRIADLLAVDEHPPAGETFDARGLHVLLGVVDPHVHTRHPGGEAREDFSSGTAAAAAGGVTTIFEMPISKVPTNSAANLRARVEAMGPQAHVDYALYGGAGRDNLGAIAEQAEAGAIAFKTFLQPPPSGREDEFHGLWCRHDEVRAVMDAVRATGLRHCFHCEEPGLYDPLRARLESRGRTRGRAHAESRPPACEEISVAVVLARAAERPLPIGIVHCSSPFSAVLASDARLKGLNITVEVCTPYLFWTTDALDRLGPYAKCNPPLRSAECRDDLWHAIQSGNVEYLGTDHSPFTAEDKERFGDDIFKAPPGIAGLDIYVPLMLTAVHQRKITLPQVVAVCSENPAYVFRLPNKGRLVPGADADFTIVDLKRKWRFDVSKARTRSRANMRLWDGFRLRGAVVATMVRGTVVCRDGEIVGAPGYGRFQRPNLDVDGGRAIAGALWGAGPL